MEEGTLGAATPQPGHVITAGLGGDTAQPPSLLTLPYLANGSPWLSKDEDRVGGSPGCAKSAKVSFPELREDTERWRMGGGVASGEQCVQSPPSEGWQLLQSPTSGVSKHLEEGTDLAATCRLEQGHLVRGSASSPLIYE